MNRRSALRALLTPSLAPAILSSEGTRPSITHGVQSGDVTSESALVWVRADRPSRMIIEVSHSESFAQIKQRIRGPHLLVASDFTGRHVIENLPARADVYYRVFLEDLSGRVLSEAATGHFRTAPTGPANIRFFWSGDMVGQGWGINLDKPGIPTFQAMLDRQPDFFLHSGDTIYADSPLKPSITLKDGSIWRNLVTPAKSKVAESLDDFRGNYQYNLLDTNVKKFNAQIPQIWAWDDHEICNNYHPALDLSSNPSYREKSIDLLIANGTQAYLEYAPMRRNPIESQRIYRKISYGPLMDLFVLDLRSYRGPNTYNRQETEGPDTAMLGAEQRAWLKRELVASTAVWKIIACDMPIGVLVGDSRDSLRRMRYENQANGDGPALGRELEFADLFAFLKRENIRNHVWLTADIHYTAAHRYNPAQAQFTDFEPFWEFVSGPLQAYPLNPAYTDNTFGFERVFAKGREETTSVLPENQFYGEVEIDSKSTDLKVTLRDAANTALFTQTILRQRDRIDQARPRKA